MMKKRIFSGIQPTGNIHIGNYLGAIRQWVVSQAETDNVFCIVDLHAITVPQDAKNLKTKTREVAGLLFAAGIDPKLSEVFVQSDIPAHAELAWILNCFIPMGWMQRMTQFKEKSQKQKEQVSVGLFDYPALMAADILLYQTDLVPVGEDQKQHAEMARDVAQRFNSIYGLTFKMPEPVIAEEGARIMGLNDPAKKMSKSEKQGNDAIGLLDSPEDILRKIRGATTDSLHEIRFDKNKPGINNLLTIYALFSGLSHTEVERRFEGKGYAVLKQELADIIIENLKPLQSRYRELMKEPAHIDRMLTVGASRVRPTAEKTLRTVKDKIGLG
jgi:tryptophanyl-tRNA synthetase